MMTYVEGTMKKGKYAGDLKGIKGYWGDIVVSPYLSFGVDCATPGELEDGLFEIMNKDTGVEQHRHHAAEVSVYSLLCCLWETETGETYRMARKNDIYSGLGSEAKAMANSTRYHSSPVPL
jgi:dynein assembly factor 3